MRPRTFQLMDGYETLVQQALRGRWVSSRQGGVTEIEDVLITVNAPPALVGFPGYRHPLALTETAQIISGEYNLEQLEKFAPSFSSYSDGWGAYSRRLPRQIPALIEELRLNPNSRRAVLAPWNPDDDLLHMSGKTAQDQAMDHPCTLSLGFRARDGRLNMSVTMRSNDLWLGLPTDFTMFSILQATIAGILGLEVGSYLHYSHSVHIYDRNRQKIIDWLESFVNPWDITLSVPTAAFGHGTWESAQEEARAALAGGPVVTSSASDLASEVLLHDTAQAGVPR